jgi:chromosome partitioning related protein ParA
VLVVCIISTKGGEGKTTTAANLGEFIADAGLRVVLVDLDVQPTLSSYFAPQASPWRSLRITGAKRAAKETLISQTAIGNLDIVLSNNNGGQLSTLLLHAPDGRLRLRHLLPAFEQNYDLMLLDTQGARSVLLEMAVLASHLALCPVTSEVLAARELHRGTIQLMRDLTPFRHLRIQPPPLRLLINRLHPVSTNARAVRQALRQMFLADNGVTVLDTHISSLEAYPRAAALALPVHRVEFRRRPGRAAPAALDTMMALACKLSPQWSALFASRPASYSHE